MDKRSLKKKASAILPNRHDITVCWNPHFHEALFRPELAKTFRSWYEQQFEKEVPHAAPLCVFGGVQHVPYVTDAHASGTYAVCSECRHVTGCGYHDRRGLGPRCCENCATRYGFDNYFQPVFPGSIVNDEMRVDAEHDAAITVSEVCGLVSAGIPLLDLPAIIAIMKREERLATGFYINDLKIDDGRVTSPSVRYRLTGWPNLWAQIDPTSRRFNVKLTKKGQALLRARNLIPVETEVRRLNKLLALRPGKLQKKAILAVATCM